MLKFLAKVVVASVGMYGLNEFFRKTQILEQVAGRAVVAGVGIVDQMLTNVAQRAAAAGKSQGTAAQNGGAQ